MSKKAPSSEEHLSPFEQIKQIDDTGAEFWSSRDFAQVLEYDNYRNFERVIKKARLACFNSGHKIEDHFVDADDMIEIGKGGKRSVKTILMSRYACYLAIQNADPARRLSRRAKPILPFRPGGRNSATRIGFWKTIAACSCGTSSSTITPSWPMPPRAPGSSNPSTTPFSKTTATRASTTAWNRPTFTSKKA